MFVLVGLCTVSEMGGKIKAEAVRELLQQPRWEIKRS